MVKRSEQMTLNKSNLTHIGKVLDAHGIRGDIYCYVFSGDASWVPKLRTVYLNEVKFNVLRAKAFKKGFIASLEEVTDRNRAEELKGAEVRVDSGLFVSKNGEAFYLVELLNFQVTDKQLGSIGVIEAFSSNGIQDLLIVKSEGKVYEIPFVKDFVANIDYNNKIINMQLPEGLLEINETTNE